MTQPFLIAPVDTLIVSLAVLLVVRFAGLAIEFDLTLRDLFLLAFFSTIGLNAKFNRLKSGGRTLGILLVLAAVFLILQDIAGVVMVQVMGLHPGYGLTNAAEIGIAFATFGLVAGGLLGGPMGEWLIKRHDLAPGATPVAIANMDALTLKHGPCQRRNAW